MKKVSIITAEEAALKVQDGDTMLPAVSYPVPCPETLSKLSRSVFLRPAIRRT